MAEQRLIDANWLLKEADESLCENPHTGVMAQAMHTHEHKHFMCMIIHQPTIDPESLPIVQQLRAELKAVKADRDAAVKDMHQNSKCFICMHLPADKNMAHCEHYAACGLNYIHWKWRGAKENSNANQKD